MRIDVITISNKCVLHRIQSNNEVNEYWNSKYKISTTNSILKHSIHPSIHVYFSETSNQTYGTYISTIEI